MPEPEEMVDMTCCECKQPVKVTKAILDLVTDLAQGIFPEMPRKDIVREAKITYVCTPCRVKVN